MDPKIVSEIVMFVDNHEHVRFSPNMNNTLKVKWCDKRVAKKILEISVNNLLMDLSKSGMDGVLDEEGNLTLGDTTF